MSSEANRPRHSVGCLMNSLMRKPISWSWMPVGPSGAGGGERLAEFCELVGEGVRGE
jgi:hypothetical protein